MLIKFAKIFHLRKSKDPKIVTSSRQTFIDSKTDISLSSIEEETDISELDNYTFIKP